MLNSDVPLSEKAQERLFERRLPLHGSPNFRDFGGYHTDTGREVKTGYLFRSGHLATLNEADVAMLAALQLDLICDFRREEEQLSEPSRLPSERRPKIASLPIIPGSNSRFLEEARVQQSNGSLSINRQAMFDFMVEINRDFAEGQSATYARMFAAILEHDNARFLVHCAAGKDRTGFAVALVLMALGVPEQVVMQDYLLTSQYFKPEEQIERLKVKYGMEGLDSEAVTPMLEVHEDYLRRALHSINSNYGSVDTYLHEVLGLGPAEMNELQGRYLV